MSFQPIRNPKSGNNNSKLSVATNSLTDFKRNLNWVVKRESIGNIFVFLDFFNWNWWYYFPHMEIIEPFLKLSFIHFVLNEAFNPLGIFFLDPFLMNNCGLACSHDLLHQILIFLLFVSWEKQVFDLRQLIVLRTC